RPWRKGAINLAIGCAGINAFKYNEGKKDLYGRILQHSLVCQIDQIASAAELVMGQADEGLPVIIVRGYSFEKGAENSKSIHRTLEENLFR
ncbi:MAG: coenzyme F420-0:L-glutamate ligase, partial [Candidatus Thorarchaeota archaeon]